MAKRSTKLFILAIGMLLVTLGIVVVVDEGEAEWLILATLTFTIYAAYSSIALDSVEVKGFRSSRAYLGSLPAFVIELTVSIILAGSLKGRWVNSYEVPIVTFLFGLIFAAGILTFYGGRQAKKEWEEHNASLQREYRTPDHGIPISSSG